MMYWLIVYGLYWVRQAEKSSMVVFAGRQYQRRTARTRDTISPMKWKNSCMISRSVPYLFIIVISSLLYPVDISISKTIYDILYLPLACWHIKKNYTEPILLLNLTAVRALQIICTHAIFVWLVCIVEFFKEFFVNRHSNNDLSNHSGPPIIFVFKYYLKSEQNLRNQQPKERFLTFCQKLLPSLYFVQTCV